jgi:hypothetical protein
MPPRNLPPQKKSRTASHTPTPVNVPIANILRKNTAYTWGRNIVTGTAIINSIIGPALVYFSDFEVVTLFVRIGVGISIILFWTFFYQIGHAFFDMADSLLDSTRRKITEEALKEAATPTSFSAH